MIGAPWWVLSLVTGTMFGATMFAVGLAQGGPATSMAVSALVGGAVFGLVMGPLARRANVRHDAALGDLTADQRREARRAAWRGPVPADPAVRRTAHDLVVDQISTYRRLRWAVVMYAGFLVLAVLLVVTESAWHALELPVFGGLLLAHLWMPGHLRRRCTRLAADRRSPVS